MDTILIKIAVSTLESVVRVYEHTSFCSLGYTLVMTKRYFYSHQVFEYFRSLDIMLYFMEVTINSVYEKDIKVTETCGAITVDFIPFLSISTPLNVKCYYKVIYFYLTHGSRSRRYHVNCFCSHKIFLTYFLTIIFIANYCPCYLLFVSIP